MFLDQTQVIEKEVSILTFKPPVFSNHHITLTFWLVHSMEVKTGPCVYTYEHTYISGQIIIFHQPGFPFSVAPIWACEPEVGRSRAIQDETEICVALLTTPKSQRTAPSLTGNICWAANKRKTVWSNSMWICIRTHPPRQACHRGHKPDGLQLSKGTKLNKNGLGSMSPRSHSYPTCLGQLCGFASDSN